MGLDSLFMHYLKVISSPKRLANNRLRAVDLMKMNYPELYEFMKRTIVEKKECPLCGKKFRSGYGFSSHVKSKKCSDKWIELVALIRYEYPVAAIENYINSVRREHGLPPIFL